MNPKVEKRRDFLINLLFLGAVLGLTYVFFKYIFWLAAPFIISFFFAVLLQKPLRWLDKRTKHKAHGLWSVALVVLSILIIIGPVALILSSLGARIADFISYITEQLNDLPTFLTTLENEILDFIKFLPDSLYATARNSITEFFTNLLNDNNEMTAGIDLSTIQNTLTSGISGVYSVVKNIPSILLNVVIGIIAWIFFTKDYNHIVRFIQAQLPEKNRNALVETKQIFSKTLKTMFKAYGLIMLITFIELCLGFSVLSMLGIMKNRYFVFIAMAIAIFDILPVAGSGGILLPWAFICVVTGNYKQAIGLLIIYLLITVIRQYIEPKIVGNSLGVNPIVTLMCLFFGLKLFGFMGMLIVPITVMTLKTLNDSGRISIWKTIPERN